MYSSPVTTHGGVSDKTAMVVEKHAIAIAVRPYHRTEDDGPTGHDVSPVVVPTNSASAGHSRNSTEPEVIKFARHKRNRDGRCDLSHYSDSVFYHLFVKDAASANAAASHLHLDSTPPRHIFGLLIYSP
jgi:hypothetical protein